MGAHEAMRPDRQVEPAPFHVVGPPAAANENDPGSRRVLDHWPAAFIILAAVANLLWIGCLAWLAGWLILAAARWIY
jgi:hypothetical protein